MTIKRINKNSTVHLTKLQRDIERAIRDKIFISHTTGEIHNRISARQLSILICDKYMDIINANTRCVQCDSKLAECKHAFDHNRFHMINLYAIKRFIRSRS